MDQTPEPKQPPDEEEAGMPVVLQVIGAIASLLLSQYTAYDDSHVRDMLKDIAYDLNLALQKLDEIAAQIDKLGAAIAALPEQEYKIIHSEALSALNTEIKGALIQYTDLLTGHKGPDSTFFTKSVKKNYNEVWKARSELEAYSSEGSVEFAPLAAVVSPLAMLLELGLLYRLGRQAYELRT